MKYLPTIAGGLLGLVFIASAAAYFSVAEMPAPPAGSPAAHFMAAFIPTGYMNFVKVCELTGGLLVAIPKTRNFGLLVLGPIILNILAYHIFVTGGADLAVPALIGVIAVYLLWTARGKFAALRN